MPGEDNVAQEELSAYRRGEKAVKPLNVEKRKDERLMDLHWTTASDKLRLVRRDRTQRNLNLIEVDVSADATKTLLSESIENANLEPQPVRYLKKGGDMIWWSE